MLIDHIPQYGTNAIKPDVLVDELTRDEGIKYKGTFDSMNRTNRTALFQALITPDEFRYPLMLEIQRDKSMSNRIYIVIQNPKLAYDIKEFHISLKQATNLLMRCNHDFRLMVSELLCIRNGKISLRNLVLDTFNPNKDKQIIVGSNQPTQINQNSSKMLSNLPAYLTQDSGAHSSKPTEDR